MAAVAMSTLQQRGGQTNSLGSKALRLSSPIFGQQTTDRTLSSGTFSTGASLSDSSRSVYNPNGSIQSGSGSMSLTTPTSGSFGLASGSTHGSYITQAPSPFQTPRPLVSPLDLSTRSVGSSISDSSAYRPQTSGVVQFGSSSATPSLVSAASINWLGTGPVSSCCTSRASSATRPPRSSQAINPTSLTAGLATLCETRRLSAALAGVSFGTNTQVLPTGIASLDAASTLSSSSRPNSRMSSAPHSITRASPLKVRDSAVMNNSRPTDHQGSKLSSLRTATRSFSNNSGGELSIRKDEMTAGPAIAQSPQYGVYSNDRTMRPTAGLMAAKKEAVVQSPPRTDNLEKQVDSAFCAWTVDGSAKARAEAAAATAAVDKDGRQAAERAKLSRDIAAARAENAAVAREDFRVAAEKLAAGGQRVERAAAVQTAAQKLAAIRAEAEDDWDRAVQPAPWGPEQAAALPMPPGPMLKRTTAEKSIEAAFVSDTSMEANPNGLVTTASDSEDQQLVDEEYRAQLLEQIASRTTMGAERDQAGANVAQANVQAAEDLLLVARGLGEKASQAADDLLPVARDLAEKARSTLSLAGHQLDSAKKAATEATLRGPTEQTRGGAGPSRWEMAANVALDQGAMLLGLALADLELAEDALTSADQSPR